MCGWAGVVANIRLLPVRADVFHRVMSWLKLVADRNLPGCASAPEYGHVPAPAPEEVQHSHDAHPRHTRSVPLRDVLVEVGGIFKSARLCVSTGASARPRIGTIGKCSTHIEPIVVTFEVSHTEMSRLKLVAS